MLELPVLGLLKGRAMHGYELRKQLGTMLGPLWQVSWGSLYPTLRRLARAGAVEKVADTGPTSKSGALASGRRRTVYRITPSGEALFTRILGETGAAVDAEHFTLKLAISSRRRASPCWSAGAPTSRKSWRSSRPTYGTTGSGWIGMRCRSRDTTWPPPRATWRGSMSS